MLNTIYNNILSEELVLSLQQSIDKELSRRKIKNIPIFLKPFLSNLMPKIIVLL